MLTKLAADDSGATAVEYALVAAAIAAIIALVVWVVGTKVSNGFNSLNSKMP